MAARTLMVQGTSSSVGKSWLTAALCRIYARRGLRVLPFKAQNMSRDVVHLADGSAIAHSQAWQALAAGVPPRPELNPILVVPRAETSSDLYRYGQYDAELSALPWRERAPHLRGTVRESLAVVRAEAELVIIEGAGSPAEINLPDVVNMRVAQEAEAPVILVADIDRGGAFASLYGTWALIQESDRVRIRGFVLNKLRGDPTLLAPAPEILEEKTGVPMLGVVPMWGGTLMRSGASMWDAMPMRSRTPLEMDGAVRTSDPGSAGASSEWPLTDAGRTILDRELDQIADLVEESLDMDQVDRLIGLGTGSGNRSW